MMGFVADDIVAVANNAFMAANPAAAYILANVQIPVTDVSGYTLRISEGEDSDAAVRAMAAEWIAANRTLVDSWIEGAIAAAN
jgi:glycine betaine/proline transport system substrate-binding protein